MNQPSEAEKFFNSLPSEKDTEKFSFFEQAAPEKEAEHKEESETSEPEKDEEEEDKPRNRQERRRESMRFYEEQLRERDERINRLEELMLRGGKDEPKVDDRIKKLLYDVKSPEEGTAVFNELVQDIESRAEERAIARLQQTQEEAAQAESAALGEIESGIEAIEDNYGVDLSSRRAREVRGKFLDFVGELSENSYGEIESYVNFEKAWELFQSNQKSSSSPETVARKREIASRSVQRSAPQRPNPDKLEPMTFDKVDSVFGKMFRR